MTDAMEKHDAGDDPDASMVDRVLSGDVDAYARLVARHRDRCLRYAYRMLGDLDEAEDVTQDALMRAYRSLARCQERTSFGAWLFRILVNRCRTAAVRRQRRLFQHAMDAERHDGTGGVGEGGEVQWEVAEEIDRALARLNAAHREAFLLKYVEEMTYEEMAALTGVSISALKMRVSRACDMLREELAEVYDGR
jgi:RNA polymerase sigma-70 factor (ECF subfamily)